MAQWPCKAGTAAAMAGSRIPPAVCNGSSLAAAALSAAAAGAGVLSLLGDAECEWPKGRGGRTGRPVGSSFAGPAMPVASPHQHKESAASTVSRYLLPKPPRHSPPLLPSPGPHHGFSPDPQACLQLAPDGRGFPRGRAGDPKPRRGHASIGPRGALSPFDALPPYTKPWHGTCALDCGGQAP
ncbi:hypothetical protein HPB50_004501 [Hyalomma asiaticum]|uniref:Uncharacterized protein n=1 Tax=Hyalomma asiaticum TaxID=266040 RepID=A0ACB7TCN2_HYAAI|nr:hypothetical protein HPB50_004501 [Hyalomma asiaticum]